MSKEYTLNGSDDCKIKLPKSEYVRYLNQVMERKLNNENYEECSKIRDRLKLLNQNKEDDN